MKKATFTYLAFAFSLLLAFTLPSCKKDQEIKKPDSQKYTWITGTWKQKDLQLGVTAELGGQTIPEGTSMIALAPLIGQALGSPEIAQAILCTKDNSYTFNADSTFSINGCTTLILPNAGNSGKWKLTVYEAVLQLTSQDGKNDPHWINDITENTLNLSLTVHIPGVGDAPLNLLLEKQK